MSSAPAPLVLERGAVIGRYLVLGRLGEGGMGIVVSAYDPDLDRRVALKLVRDDALGADAGAQARLQAEAQAMARVAHPNVVAVYDVGAADGRLFLAMEHVSGDLAHWLAAVRRPWRAVLAMFLAAGRGLAAAHASGLVHRDFKPGNVLVGADERPRVSDFGLAAALAAAATDQGVGPATTTSGGTPAYMAPEQHRGLRGDARTDQFSFCVALAEALHGRRPFPGRTVDEVRESVLGGRLQPPPEEAGTPAWLWDALRRGMAVDPAERHPDMDHLLAALDADPDARQRRRVALDALLVFGRTRASAGDLAAGDAVLRQALGEAQAIGDRSRVAMARLGLVEVLASNHGREADAEAMLAEVEPLFAAGATLDLEVAEAKTLEARLHDARGTLARARRRSDEAGDAFERAVELYGEAMGPGHVQVARALANVGLVRAEQHRFEDSIAAFERALAVAEAARGVTALDVAAIRSSFASVYGAQGRFEEARVQAEASLSARQRALGEDHPLVGQEHNNLAILLHQLGSFGDAMRHFERALEIAERALGPNDPSTASSLANLGNMRLTLGDFAGARAALERALAMQERLRGPDDPEVGSAIANLGVVHYDLGELDAALACHQRALGIFQAAFGPDHPRTANSQANVASILSQLGRVDEACATYERVIAVLERTLGPRHVDLATTLSNLGQALLRRVPPDTGRARDLITRAHSISVDAVGPDHPDVSRIESNLAELAVAVGDHPEARARFARAVAIIEGALGAQHPAIGAPLVGLGNACLSCGDPAAAALALGRAVGIADLLGSDAGQRATIDISLAAALWATGEEERAVEVATRSRDAFASLGEEHAGNRDAVAAWIASRVGSPASSPPA